MTENEIVYTWITLAECAAGVIIALHYWYYEIYKKRNK